MAVSSNPLIGKTRGSAGGITFTSWKGINVFKNKAETVANPQSDAQMAQRNRITLATALYRTISAALNYGFKEKAIKMSAFNAFSSYNTKNGFSLTPPTTITVDYPNFRVSDGSLGSTAMTTAVVDASDANLVVTYPTTTPLSGQAATDIIGAVIYNVDEDYWEDLGLGDTRADGTSTFAIVGALTAADVVKVYTYFVKDNFTKSSVSTMDSVVVQA